MNRVVITGMGIVSPIGNTVDAVKAALLDGRSGIRVIPEWAQIKGLKCQVAGTVTGIVEKEIPRTFRRTMGRMAVLGTFAARDAVKDAGVNEAVLASGRAGVAIGSTMGSAGHIESFCRDYHKTGGIESVEGTLFMRVMSHSVAANVAAVLGLRGQLLAPCSACTSSTQAIGIGYEAIRAGQQDLMLCGGAEEMHPFAAAPFDVLGATSRAYNNAPQRTPRPFDRDRDGLVVSEGAAVLVLENYEHARARGARILAEILGYATNCGASHMTVSDAASMASCMKQALDSAGISARDLSYINAHATGTVIGDCVEAEVTRNLVGDAVPVSSTKGQTGHSLAACGAMEAIFCVLMMRHGFLAPTMNLENIGPDCEGLAHVRTVTAASPEIILSSNFAFGGVNASIIFGKA